MCGHIMWLKEIIWIERYKSKIETKHNVTAKEVEESLTSEALFRRVNRGRVKGEDVYIIYL